MIKVPQLNILKSFFPRVSSSLINVSALIGVAFLVIIMLVPLPGWALDFLMAINLGFSILIVLIVLMNRRAIDFAIFPQLLLVTTLFGLALNLSSTRKILQEGADFDGNVVRAFATFVVGGTSGDDVNAEQMVIGTIIFLIIVAVQLVVLTKGATRVSEVAARFTLDSLPSKQVAIEQEFSQGVISEEEAKQKKKDLEKESNFYGTMDGATKFISGNAKLGILITAINLVGGLIIGMAIKGYDFTQAIETYLILTIGDGLVSQFPALFINTATGFIVTRAISDNAFGEEAVEQFSNFSLVYYVAGGFMFAMGLIPGFGFFIFAPLGILLIFLGYRLSKKKKAEAIAKIESEQAPNPVEGAGDISVINQPDVLVVELGCGLIPFVDQDKGSDLLDRITKVRRSIATNLGVIVPKIRIVDNMDLEPTRYAIKIKGIEVATGIIERGRLLAIENQSVVDKIEEGIRTVDPTFGLPAIWISEDMRTIAERRGYTVVDGPSIIVTHLSVQIQKNADELIGRQEVLNILNALKNKYSAVVEEVQKNLTLGQIQKVLQLLLEEEISIRNIVTILEELANYALVTKDPYFLCEKVRQKLKSQIIKNLLDSKGFLNVVVFESSLEQKLVETTMQTPNGALPGIDIVSKQKIINEYIKLYQSEQMGDSRGVILTSESIRRVVKRLFSSNLPDIKVISTSEIPPNISVNYLAQISIDEKENPV